MDRPTFSQFWIEQRDGLISSVEAEGFRVTGPAKGVYWLSCAVSYWLAGLADFVNLMCGGYPGEGYDKGE